MRILFVALTLIPTLGHAETLYFLKGKIHTELAVSTDSIRDLRPELVEHVDTDLVLVGWGEKSYFGNPDKTVLGTMKAMLLPTSATIKLEGVSEATLSTKGRVETMEISTDEQQRLLAFIDYTAGSARFHKEIDNARYFRARGTYTAFNTCNNWTGRALNHAGVDVESWRSWLAGNLHRQVRHRLADGAETRDKKQGASTAASSRSGF